MRTSARIYQRRNGTWGASCDGTQDTGHHIDVRNGRFTVVSVHDEATFICEDATREDAEKAVTTDWRQP